MIPHRESSSKAGVICSCKCLELTARSVHNVPEIVGTEVIALSKVTNAS